MSLRGRGGSGGGSDGRGFGGGRGYGRGRGDGDFNKGFDQGPPQHIIPLGMSFHGRSGGGDRGYGGGPVGGRGRGGGGFNTGLDQGPPEHVIPLGYYERTVQDELICKVEIEDVPSFNAPIYLEDKQQIGQIDDIVGKVGDYFVTIRLGKNMHASMFKVNQKLYIDPAELLPLDQFRRKLPGPFKNRGGRGRGGGGRGDVFY